MRIAIDAMGGDHAPREIVTGTVAAARDCPGSRLFLVGDRSVVADELKRQRPPDGAVEIVHAPDVVRMDEPPAHAVRRKRGASICRALDLVGDGRADAVFSAGNTGAAVAAATLRLRRLPGLERPAIATVLPTPKRPFVLLDSGANSDCTPAMLVQFAVMGSVYAREILGRRAPSVGLLGIGEEAAKGNVTTKEAHRLLRDAPIRFAGNVESHDIFRGCVDVVVCDGFVGNVVLKASEGVTHAIDSWLAEEARTGLLPGLGYRLLREGIRRTLRRGDPARYGGAPLLGLNGTCIIGHGASCARSVASGIRVAAEAVRHRLNETMAAEIRRASPTMPARSRRSRP